MARFILKRLVLGVVTLLATSILTFTLLFSVNANPVKSLCSRACNATQLAAVKKAYGLDQPKLDQYEEYMKGIFVGRDYPEQLGGHCSAPCLGYSFSNEEAVTSTITRVMPVTLSIVLPALVLWVGIGIALGMVSGIKQGSRTDRVAVGFTLVGASLQLYTVAELLLLIFVYQLHWLPDPSYTSPFHDPLKWASGLVLPWITLALLSSAVYARLTRAQMIETLSEDYIRTARAKGLRTRTIYLRHAWRAAMTPIVTIAGLDLGAVLGGVIITEHTFGLQGLGTITINAVHDLDFATTMAVVLLGAVFVIVANLLVDVLLAVIDPRVRFA
jgi:peptide/nickel transport system permease protein